MPRPEPKIFSIPAGVPFLPALADALLAGRLAAADGGPPGRTPDDPLALADATILLPTRRAVRALRELLVERLAEGGAAVLPVIRPIGDVEEEDQLLDLPLDGLSEGPDAPGRGLPLPPPATRLARQLALTRLTLAWGKALSPAGAPFAEGEPLLIPASAADATRLAADLARLMDDMTIAGKPWEALDGLAPEDHAAYFQLTLDFLRLAGEAWPRHLAEIGRVDPVERRDRLIRAEAGRLRNAAPRGPMVAAGSTGSVPATRALLAAVARLPSGAVVLPGLDRHLDAEGWEAIGDGSSPASAFGHPQFGQKQLLAELGVARDDVADLVEPPAPVRVRASLISEALRPAETTERWAGFRAGGADARAVEAALAGAALIVARNEQEEALAIALAVREALEEPAATVALVTPDRTLARRVAVELGRWELAVDDSAGTGLDLLPAGIFARLLAEAAGGAGDPARLLALLKHPLAGFGMDRPDCRRAARMLELALFRGRRVAGGVGGLAEALAAARREAEEGTRHVSLARRRLNPSDWSLAARLVDRIEAVLGSLESYLGDGRERPLPLLADHALAALRAAAADRTGRDDALWSSPGGSALAELLTGLAEDDAGLAMSGREFPAFLAALMADVLVPGVRPQPGAPGGDPRIHFWGVLEARLQTADVMILAGLDEGIWPGEVRTDPWLSRAMRAEVGLQPPERRIGLAAHDFAMAFTVPRVIVTRAEKRGGAPTVPSRWLQRFMVLVGAPAAERLRTRGEVHVARARDLDRVAARDVRPAPRPAPAPPVDARPRRLSVTEIETLVRDPYAIYARRVLRLEPLDGLGLAPDYALRGSLIHEALGRFTAGWSGPFDAAAAARLVAIGRETLAEIADFPDVHAVWSIRFAAIAAWFVAWEAGRAGDIAERRAEVEGEMPISAPAGPFLLRGRADRIDLRHDGRVAVIDFKTGTPPSARQVLVGFAPQLGLEAAMVRAGAFGEELAGRPVAELAWIALGRVLHGRPVLSAVENGRSADDVAAATLDHLAELVAAFDDPARAYVSRARPMFETRFESPYDHLARVREWGLVESEEDLSWLPPQR